MKKMIYNTILPFGMYSMCNNNFKRLTTIKVITLLVLVSVWVLVLLGYVDGNLTVREIGWLLVYSWLVTTTTK